MWLDVEKDKDGFRVVLRAQNGKQMMRSKAHARRMDAVRAAEKIQNHTDYALTIRKVD